MSKHHSKKTFGNRGSVNLRTNEKITVSPIQVSCKFKKLLSLSKDVRFVFLYVLI